MKVYLVNGTSALADIQADGRISAVAVADNSEVDSADSSIGNDLLVVLHLTEDSSACTTAAIRLYSLTSKTMVSKLEFTGFEGVSSLQMNVFR